AGISGGKAYYVKKFELQKNELVVTSKKEELKQKEIFLSNYNFISGETLKEKINVKARIRHGGKLENAVIYPLKKGKMKIIFKKGQLAPASGQFCVFYKGKKCLGGGMII
ncbi:MAG: aminomethyltransferase beta-barrel domain-containing protein, partial [Candidatus Micrarchaeota archaeon]